MIGWLAWIIAMLALAASPSKDEMDRIDARLTALEHSKCTMMLVSTPTGTATICARAFAAQHGSESKEGK